MEVGAGPAAGTEEPDAMRFCGAGALAVVRFVLVVLAMKTLPPPAPTAVVLGAVKGTYSSGSKKREKEVR